MSLLGLFGGGGLLNSKDSGGLLGSRLDPNMPMLMAGLGMLGNGWQGALPGLQAGMKMQSERRGVTDWESLLSGGQGTPQAAGSSPGFLGQSAGAAGAAMPSLPSGVAGRQAASGTAGQVPAQYAPMVQQAAAQYGLDPGIFGRQLYQESGFRPEVISGQRNSSAGAQGIAQFMPATAQRFGIDPLKPDQAIPAAAKYTAANRDMFGGNLGLGLAGYNWGEGNVQKWMAAGADPARMPAETRDYVQRITGRPIESWTGAGGGSAAPADAAAPAQGGVTNMAQTWLSGLTPDKRQALARIAANNPNVAAAFITRMMGLDRDTASTDDIREFQFARLNGYTGTFPEFLTLKRAQASDRGQVVGPGAAIVQDGQEVYRNPRETTPMTATDRKAVMEAEDDTVNLEGTIAALTRAKELNPKIFTGVTSGLRGTIGTKIPGGGILVDKEAAEATREWQQIMNLEAIQAMAATLKGATTNFELQEFVKVMADPAADTDIRARMLDRMLKTASRRLEVNRSRMDELRGGTYYKPGGGQSVNPPDRTSEPAPVTVPAPTPVAAPVPPPAGTKSPDLVEREENLLQKAREAIAAGAPRDQIEKRLLEYKVDPGRL